MVAIVDSAARTEAVDINGSFAVQAPAGSGKTELLSLRFLNLLAVSEKPEELLAITFTRKAANEMSERILSTLDWASTQGRADDLKSDLEREKFAAAQRVLQQDQIKDWRLQQSPQRLRIQTIDSFCHFLASRLPVLSNLGASLAIGDRNEDCYKQAIGEFIGLLERGDDSSLLIAELLLHFDNDMPRVEKLLLELLKQRDQWIEAVVDVASSPENALNYLQDNAQELIAESLQRTIDFLQPFESELMALADYAAGNLSEGPNQAKKPTAIVQCLGLTSLPSAELSELPVFRGIVELLLPKTISWRKQVSVAQGFPPASASKELGRVYQAKKDAMKSLLTELSDNDELLAALHYIRLLPELPDIDSSNEFLRTLTAILPLLLAQLDIAFSNNNKVDYPQISHAALRALGAEDNPTDLALSLDYQLKHILVDEFQDTSSLQLGLLKKLTAGWEANDGRTLFIVGDAMQSCYGFRNANVGLFIAIREHGLRDIHLEPIDLVSNFRSDRGVVDWVNQVFCAAFPAHNDISRGAVSYSASTAVHPEDIQRAVTTRCYLHEQADKLRAYDEEARYIADEIYRLRKQDPSHSIAILIRSRNHLIHILPFLREADIPWQATEIDRLNTLPIIGDLLSLSKALYNRADRLSWLAILRAPWCGIQLEDLHLLANHQSEQSVLGAMLDYQNIVGLSPWAASRINAVGNILEQAVQCADVISSELLLRQTFARLGGKLLLKSKLEADSIERFFELVADCQHAGTLQSLAEFEERVASTYVSDTMASGDDHPVQIMTIHKAKGLEFDHVFLPGLSRNNPPDDKGLLLWHERVNGQGEAKLLLATLAATHNDSNSLYELLRHEKSLKNTYENTRLLYIGVTRAKKSAYLSATLLQKDKGEPTPATKSLLGTIWQSLIDIDANVSGLSMIDPVTAAAAPIDHESLRARASILTRLKEDQTFTAHVASDVAEDTPPELRHESERDNLLQVQTGNLIHEFLQHYVDNKALIDEDSMDKQRTRWTRQLLNFGIISADIERAVATIEASLRATLADAKINWVFDAELNHSCAELAMQTKFQGELSNSIIDRCFIDADGYRWIIDYKSSQKPAAQSVEDFLHAESQRYAKQLRRYHSLFREEKNSGIRTALLFTSLPLLFEVDLANIA